MNKAPFFTIENKEIRQIRKHRIPIDAGSEITCYRYNSNNVIKLFEITCDSPEDKLFLSQKKYGNNSYTFVNKVGINENNKIICYTMPFIIGNKLNIYNFNELSIKDLLKFIEIYLQDTHKISNQGIYAYDNFISNIILNKQGFHSIDPIDFLILDKDPSIIEKDNLKIFFANFWDYLFNNNLINFCQTHHLEEQFLYEDPLLFFIELTNQISSTYGKKITHIKQMKVLTKKR